MDNGAGIPQNIVDKIFQLFTTGPTGEGTGLGLSLAYDNITKEHNGIIKAENLLAAKPGKEKAGSKFTITLPA
jgi:signal transduction histidine kinase